MAKKKNRAAAQAKKAERRAKGEAAELSSDEEEHRGGNNKRGSTSYNDDAALRTLNGPKAAMGVKPPKGTGTLDTELGNLLSHRKTTGRDGATSSLGASATPFFVDTSRSKKDTSPFQLTIEKIAFPDYGIKPLGNRQMRRAPEKVEEATGRKLNDLKLADMAEKIKAGVVKSKAKVVRPKPNAIGDLWATEPERDAVAQLKHSFKGVPVWLSAVEAAKVETTVKNPRSKKLEPAKAIPKVEVAAAGQSYNPTYADHQDAVAMSVAVELSERLEAKEFNRKFPSRDRLMYADPDPTPMVDPELGGGSTGAATEGESHLEDSKSRKRKRAASTEQDDPSHSDIDYDEDAYEGGYDYDGYDYDDDDDDDDDVADSRDSDDELNSDEEEDEEEEGGEERRATRGRAKSTGVSDGGRRSAKADRDRDRDEETRNNSEEGSRSGRKTNHEGAKHGERERDNEEVQRGVHSATNKGKAKSRPGLAQKAAAKKLNHELSQLPVIVRELKAEESARAAAHEKAVARRLHRHRHTAPRLGPHKYRERKPDVLLTDELPESLRTLKVQGDLLAERYDSLQKRNLIEVRRKQAKRPRTGVKEYERHAFRDFAI